MSDAYRLDPQKKIITIDDSVKATPADKDDILFYVTAGYIIRHKSKKRSKVAADRAKKDALTDAAIKEALKNDKKALEKYEELKKKDGKGTGFFAAKSWYKKNFLNN